MTATYDLPAMLAELARDEGVRTKPYRDTVGKLTIGIGRNLDDVGLSSGEIMLLAAHDLARAEADLDRNAPWWRGLDPVRQRVVLNMCFNMGWGGAGRGLASFTTFLAHLQAGRPVQAAAAMLPSMWSRQVGTRATRLQAMMRTGQVPADEPAPITA